MVNTRTDADLSAAVQNALQTLLPQIREEIREEFRTGSGSSNAGGNPPPVTIYTWLERFNKQKPHSFEKATALVDAENWISHIEKIFDVMGCEDSFKTRLVVYKFEGNALAWWKAYKQAKGGDAWLVPRDYDVSFAMPCSFIHVIYAISLSLYPFTERYAQPYFFSCLIRQIREKIREEFRTGSGSSNAGGNPPPVTIHTWLSVMLSRISFHVLYG
nr:zinc finger, CCHC-type, retrotransposon Gag domain protein [Tanacetum cinerariifolium]